MEQFFKYIGVPGLLVILFTCATIGWVSFKVPVPPEIYALLGASWGYYFGTNGKNIAAEIKARSTNVS